MVYWWCFLVAVFGGEGSGGGGSGGGGGDGGGGGADGGGGGSGDPVYHLVLPAVSFSLECWWTKLRSGLFRSYNNLTPIRNCERHICCFMVSCARK